MTGSIKTYTPNFKMIIPEFNIATWHDYIEENFRSIDALFHNLFGINGFSGMWKTNTAYEAGQVLFVGEDNGSIYEGRLVKIVNDTNTGGYVTFSEAIKANPKDYEFYTDASSAQIFAELSKNWANHTGSTIKTPEGEDTGEYSAKHYQTLAKGNEEQCEMYKNLTDTNVQLTQEAATSAEINENNSKVWADGNDGEVQSLGGTHSSMISAGLAFSYANADEDVPVEEWATQHNLIVQGEKGDTGPRGPEGPEGPKGDPYTETIETLLAQTTLSNKTIFRANEIASVELLIPSTIDDNFLCEVDFTSGTTPTAFTMVDTVKWRGDDLVKGSLVPQANKRYNLLFWYDGVNLNAESRGV
jgi:hypothetical protein